MNVRHYLLAAVLLITVALLGLSGCAVPGKVTGGGWMLSQACDDNGNCDRCGKANFGFNADSCDDSCSVVGHFNYHDKNAPDYADDGGVKMNGVVIEAAECVEFSLDTSFACSYCLDNYYDNDGDNYGAVYAVKVRYTSTNPKIRGIGYAVGCVIDNGEGVNATEADMAVFEVLTGPYAGYKNSGEVHGNIQAHECEDRDYD